MKIKLITILLLHSFSVSLLYGQDDEEKQRGFKKENIFVGSALNLGFSSSVFRLGANPEIGYSITRWLDAGISTNINYTSFRYTAYSDRVFNYGVGSFVRIWPVRFLFLSALPEYNWIGVTTKFVNNSQSDNVKYKAGSLLLGAGYGNRIVGQAYSYFAVMFDALENTNSPYRDNANRALPIFRAGFAFYLQPHRRR